MERSFAEACDALKAEGYAVTMHGSQFKVARSDIGTKVLKKAEVIAYAQKYIPDGQAAEHRSIAPAELLPGSTPPAAHASWPTLALINLMEALETHAAALPRPLTPSTLISIPAGLPERLLVPTSLITAGRYQPRTEFDQVALDELAESIQEHGILNPLLVFANEHGTLELIAGERRLRAARTAGLTMVPIELRAYTLLQIAEISGIDNIQRANLSPLEEGRYYGRLIKELGISENQLAKRLGQNRAAVQQRRAIAAAAPELQAALTEGKISFTQARAIAQAAPGEHATQKKALGDVVKRLGNGQQVSENEARKTAEKALRDRLLGDLTALGWQIYQGELIYSAGNAPRAWTGAEMLAAVAEQRRPDPAIAEQEVAAEVLDLVRMRFKVSRAGPWYGLATDYSTPSAWFTAADMPIKAEDVSQALDAYRARIAPHGWTLTIEGMGSYPRIAFTTAKGAREWTYYWSGLEEITKKIEAGQLADAPSLTPNRPHQQAHLKCDGCKQASGRGLQYLGPNKNYCPDCAAPVLAARRAEEASRQARRGIIERAIDVTLGAWLRAAPAGAWPLLIGSLVGEVPDDTSTADWLIDQLATTLLEADPSHDNGEYEEAPSALVLAKRIFAEAGSPTPTPEAEEAEGLLAAVDRRIDAVDANWATGLAPSLDLLDEIGDELNAAVDDPTITDAEYEVRTERLRLLYQRRLNEAEAVAA